MGSVGKEPRLSVHGMHRLFGVFSLGPCKIFHSILLGSDRYSLCFFGIPVVPASWDLDVEGTDSKAGLCRKQLEASCS